MGQRTGIEGLESFLRARGWPITRLSSDAFRSSFRGEKSTFPLVVQCDKQWSKLTVLPIVRMPADAEKAEQLYERLLKLNGEILLARFSLDEDGDVLLSVEFPSSEFDDSEIQDALDVLTYYAEKHQPEIRALVT